MNLLLDIARELIGMFIADARLTIAVLALVATVAVLLGVVQIAPLLAGAVLLFGCMAITVAVVFLEAARRRP